MTIRAFQQKAKKINLPKAVTQAIRDSEDDILMLQELQWDRGERRTGKPLPDYSPASVELFGKRPGPWTLKDTGGFRGALKIGFINEKAFEITSGDPKTKEIVAKAGATIFGLNAKTRSGSSANEPLASGIIFPRLKKNIQKQSGLNL